MKSKSFYVYIHKKATTGDIFYVGKGSGKRYCDTKSRGKFWRDIVKKHGFVVEFVEVGLQEWYAFELESSLISLYGRLDDKTGCLANLTDGGEGSSGWMQDEKEKIRKSLAASAFMSKQENKKAFGDASKNRWKNPAYREKMSAVFAENKNNKEKAERISEIRKAYWASDNYKKRVGARISEGLLAVSQKLSEIHTEVQNRPEMKELRSKQSKDRWIDEDYRSMVISRLPRGSLHHAARPVVNLTTGEKFCTVSDAARKYGVQVANLQKVLKGERSHTGGYSWAYQK